MLCSVFPGFFFYSFFYISVHCSVQQLLMGFNQLHIVSLLMYFIVPKPTLHKHQPPAAESRSTIFTVPHSLQAGAAALPPLGEFGRLLISMRDKL